MPRKSLNPPIPIIGLQAVISFLPPDEPPCPAGVVTITTTRQRYFREPRRSLYKHELIFEIHRDDAPLLIEECAITTHAHPLSDPFDHLQRLLKATFYHRGHSSLLGPRH